MGQPQSTPTFRQAQRGDRIYCERIRGVYDHHGIYVGDGMVIQLLGAAKKIRPLPPCQKCGNKRFVNGEIAKTCIDCFLDGHSLQFFDYGVPIDEFYKRRRGTCSISHSKPAHEIIKTATDFLEKNDFGPCNLLTNNCENFAMYCNAGTTAIIQQVWDHIERLVLPTMPIGICHCQTLAIMQMGGVITAVLRRL